MNKINITFLTGILHEKPKNQKEIEQLKNYNNIEKLETTINEFKKQNSNLIISVSTLIKKGFQYMLDIDLDYFLNNTVYDLMKDENFIETLDIKNTIETKKDRIKKIKASNLTDKEKLNEITKLLNI